MARRRLLTQAQQEALVKYQPQLDALKSLVGQAQGNYAQRVHLADAGARAVQTSIGQVLPALQSFFDRSGAGAAERGVSLTHDLASLGPVADSIKAAATSEATGAANRLGALQTMSLGGLGDAYVRAAQGAQYEKGAASAQLRSDLLDIAGKTQSVLGQKGAYTTAELDSLTNAAEQRALTRRGQDLTHSVGLANAATSGANLSERTRHDRQMEKNAANRNKAAGPVFTAPGVRLLSQGSHNTLRSQIDTAKFWATHIIPNVKGHPDQRRHAANLALTVGGKSSTGKGSIPAVKDELARAVGLDLAMYGHVSDSTAHRLHLQGYSVRRLGLGGTPPRHASPPASTAGSALGLLAQALGLGG